MPDRAIFAYGQIRSASNIRERTSSSAKGGSTTSSSAVRHRPSFERVASDVHARHEPDVARESDSPGERDSRQRAMEARRQPRREQLLRVGAVALLTRFDRRAHTRASAPSSETIRLDAFVSRTSRVAIATVAVYSEDVAPQSGTRRDAAGSG